MSKNIMIVEDSDSERKLITYILKMKGFNIVSAKSGIDALERLSSSKIDIIITDLNMPQMDGLELIDSLKKEADYRSIPVIMLTVMNNERDKQKAIEKGASSYLVKPVSANVLVEEIVKLTGKL